MYKYKYILYNIIYFILALLMYLIIVTLFANFNVLSYKTVSILSFIYIVSPNPENLNLKTILL